MIKVWDLWVRIGHWFLVFCITAAWLTRHGGGAFHDWFGYCALGIVAARIAWGFFGSTHARFNDFVKSPAAIVEYAQALPRHHEQHYVGHNPLGGYMVLALLLSVALTSISGWLYTTDRFWGVAWVGESHEVLADALLILVALHIGGVVFACYRERENLIAAMFHGRKRMR